MNLGIFSFKPSSGGYRSGLSEKSREREELPNKTADSPLSPRTRTSQASVNRMSKRCVKGYSVFPVGIVYGYRRDLTYCTRSIAGLITSTNTKQFETNSRPPDWAYYQRPLRQLEAIPVHNYISLLATRPAATQAGHGRRAVRQNQLWN